MPSRTLFLSRLIGLYAVVVSLSMLVNRESMVEIVTLFLQGGPMQFFGGVIALICGLAMVLSHNIWSGGALPVVVTLIGWAALLEGVVFLLLPADAGAAFLDAVRIEDYFSVLPVIVLVLGGYLTYGGFKNSRLPVVPAQ
jgi:hypothetical protein